MADHMMSAIARRVEQAESGEEVSATIAGQPTLAGAVATHGPAMAEGTRDLEDALADSDFVLPLHAADTAMEGEVLSSLTFWGGGNPRDLEGSGGTVNWDGDLFSAHLGADIQLRDNLLTGVALSWNQGEVDYSDSGRRSNYELDLATIHPYVGWTIPAGWLDLWATVGYGQGDLQASNGGGTGNRATSDIVDKDGGHGQQ